MKRYTAVCIIVCKGVAFVASKSFDKAKKNKADEFYTGLSDIESEMRHYKEQFRGKVIFCNCDDPYESNFFKYFAMNFNFLELKKLIATCYIGSPIANIQLSLFDNESEEDKTTKSPHKIEITEVTDENCDGAVDLADVEYLLRNKKNVLTRLAGDGDFRSDECIDLLKQADIIVTNPPFSLFREYVAQLVEYGKQFIILGSQNAVTYKEIFRLIKQNSFWLGVTNGGTKWFRVPNNYEIETESRKKIIDGVKYFSMGSIFWFTNLDHSKRHVNLKLFKKYSPTENPYYDNYSAINVDRYIDIPIDFEGAMGVPITFLDKYNPEQFEVVGIDRYLEDNPNYGKRFTINGKETYARIIIKRIGDVQ